ncbi:hypothetical protein Q7P37_004135 [Cladosporium fusiforme]
MSSTEEQDNLQALLGPEVHTEPSPLPDPDWQVHGNYVTLERFTEAHIPSLWKNVGMPADNTVFRYMLSTPESPQHYWQQFEDGRKKGRIFYAIRANPARLSPSSKPQPDTEDLRTEVVGAVAFLGIEPANRDLEIGYVTYSPMLQRTAAATEVQYLLLRYAFGEDHAALSPPYRRVVWKCNNLNSASHRAAKRLGFVYEGLFRKHMIVQGRSRDTAWYSILDEEWEGSVKRGFELWFDHKNFDAEGKQIRTLEECRGTCKTA